MRKLIISMIAILSLSTCEKSSDSDVITEWKGTFLAIEPGYAWDTEHIEIDLPKELLNSLKYNTIEKDSAVAIGIESPSIESDYAIRVSDTNGNITFDETTKCDSLMEVRHYTFYTFEKGVFGRAEVTENAIILDGGAWTLNLPASYQYYFSKGTNKTESKPFVKHFHYSGEFQVIRSEKNTILENKDYTFELSADGKLVMLKPKHLEIGILDRK